MVRLYHLIMQQAARQPVVKFVPPPLIVTQQPEGYTGLVGSAFQIKVASNGTTYAFYNGTTLLNQNSTGLLSFNNAAVSDSGNYYCIVTDNYGQSLKSATVTVTISKNQTTPAPNPDPDTQPAGNGVWYVTGLTSGKTYSNIALAINNYLVYHTGANRFLNAFEYTASSAGGFTLKQALFTGQALIVWLTGSAIINADTLTAGKTYVNEALANGGYAIYRKGLNRLLTPSEYIHNTAGSFTLKQPLSNHADGLVIITSAKIVTNLADYKTYANAALATATYLVYREGVQRFLENYEYLPLSSGGFTLKLALSTTERLLIFKL